MTNQREDRWGGDEPRRSAFLLSVAAEVRQQVGDDFPVWLKLGVEGSQASGPTREAGARVAAAVAQRGIDCIEVSNSLGMPEWVDTKKEACYLPMAQAVRALVGPEYPLALVGGFRTLDGMQATLASGIVQMISLSRPLIAEPDLPQRLESGASEAVQCIRCGLCRAERPGDGIACHRDGGGLDLRRPLESLDILRV
jgi:2,4-dienoyl-CoA reductase-like NADH-dependent reductase (Old Yellow Enzyme family)